MKQTKILDTLLKYLTPEDFDQLIAQEKLKLDGYVLHFVIDADLIGNYCFPRGIVQNETQPERQQKLTDDYISDEQVTLHSILNLNKKSNRVILFDEHVPEFKAMINKASKNKTDEIRLAYEHLNFKTISDEKIKNFLYDNFSKVIADVKLKVNGLKKALDLIKEKQIIFEASEFENTLIKEATEQCRVSDRQDQILDFWSKIMAMSLLPPSKKRDAGIVDRILSINQYIQQKGSNDNKKNVFIYLTDSSKTKKLFDELVPTRTEIFYPLIDERKIHFIRSIPQTFAYLISLRYNTSSEVDIKGTIESLIELKKTSQSVTYILEDVKKVVGVGMEGNTFESDLFESGIFENYYQLRNIFENTGLLKSFSGLHESIKNEIKDLRLLDIQHMFDRIKKEKQTLLHDLTNKHSDYLTRLYEEALFNTAYIKGLNSINKIPFNLSKGCDSVEGSYQHLPIFLCFPSQNIGEHMNNLMLLILDQKDEDNQFALQTNAIVNKMVVLSSSVEEEIETKLLKAFILMIMPSVADIAVDKSNYLASNNDTLAERWLNIIYLDNKIDPLLHPHLYADLLYELCWVTRRIGKYSEALDYAEKGLKQFPTDPRFHHGAFLAKYSKFEEEKNELTTEQKLAILNAILENLSTAQRLYAPFLINNFLEFNYDLMQLRLSETFFNSSCYIISLIAYEYHKQQKDQNNKVISELLKNAREQLSNLKVIGGYVVELAEYYDTEAFLEYLESFYCSDKRGKAENAKNAIKKAMSLSRSTPLTIKYNDKYNQIEERLKQLV